MIVTRGDLSFSVCDEDLSGDWGFWARFSDGSWEPEILDRIPDLIDGGTYVDIGSWIGPQLLVASNYADRCVGFEPDPTAFDVLAFNVDPVDNIDVHHAAISDVTGWTKITNDGDSTSRIGTGDHVVPCYTLADAVEQFAITDVALVKIDIEGAEQYVIPDAADVLRSFGCPVFLSIHPWVSTPDLSVWRVERLADHEVLLWPT